MKFSGLTKKGRAYLAKCQASSTPIQFTKMKFGDGKLIDNENPADLIDIKNIKIEKSILSKEQKGDAVVLTTVIDNVSLEEGYFPRETGIYVLDEGVEVLYFYMNDGDETSWIPPEADGPHRMEVKINLISSNTGSILVHNDGKDLYITKEYLEANYTQKGEYNGTAQEIEDRVVASVGKEDGKFPLTESIVGNVYYFPGNKKFYICKTAENRKVSVPNGNFEELSIWENRKRLENFSKYEFKNNWEQIINCESMSAQIITAGRILVQILTYNFNRKIDKTRLTFPKTFSTTPFVTITDNDNAVASRNLDYAIGWNTSSYVDISNVVGGFTMLLIGII